MMILMVVTALDGSFFFYLSLAFVFVTHVCLLLCVHVPSSVCLFVCLFLFGLSL